MTSSWSLNWQCARRKTSALYRGAASCIIPSSFLEEGSIEEKGSLDNQTEPHSSGVLAFSELLQRLHKAAEGQARQAPWEWECADSLMQQSYLCHQLLNPLTEPALLTLRGEQNSNTLHKVNPETVHFPSAAPDKGTPGEFRGSRVLGSNKSYLWWVGNFGTTEIWTVSPVQRTNRSERAGVSSLLVLPVLSDGQHMWKDFTNSLNGLT